MPAHFKKSLLIALIIFSSFGAFAQIACTPTAGCAPLVGVSFTGLTGATNILWNFGDLSYSNINNPTHTFSAPGTYVVTYTATIGASPVTQTLSVKAFPKPTPNFTYTIPSTHCVGMQVGFTDQSTGANGTPITNWQWAFGDGGVSGSQNPNYAYTVPGTFNVTLIAKDANGCDSSVTKAGIIHVSATPTVVITSNPLSLSSCTVPFTANFSGNNSISGSPFGGALTYTWNFGNGGSSNAQTPPAQTYTANGTYTVQLGVTDNNNCSGTNSVVVSLLQPSVTVRIPDTVCYGQKFIVRDTSKATYTYWNFGDGSPGEYNFPNDTIMHQYLSPGNHTITITATTGSCQSSKTFVIYVQQVVANFVGTPPSLSCYNPYVANYINTSTWGSTYQWTFPTGPPVTTTNATYTLSQVSQQPWTIYKPWPIDVQLIAISHFGCRDTIIQTLDTLHRLTAFFYANKLEGCVPLTVTFRDSSFSTTPINYYNWSFGDGSPHVIGPIDSIVVHTYTATGTYSVTLIVQNVPGCRDTSFQLPITVVNPPNPSFTFSPSVVCPNQPVTIINTTNPADSVNHWHVSSDQGYFSGCITDPNPSWNFNHTGVFTFTMTAYTHGCRSDVVSTQSVTVKGPIASGRYFTRCDSSYKVKFTALLQDAQYGVWDYGDGSTYTVTGSGAHTTYHTYTASGNYKAILTGYNASTGCQPFKDTLIVTVRKIKAMLTNQPITCAGIFTAYNSGASQDVAKGCGVGYTWYFGNLPPVVSEHSATSYSLPAGTHNVKLVVRDTNNCADTAYSIIHVSAVQALIAVTPSVGCLPAYSITPVNNSISDTTTTYTWNFGDGSPSEIGFNPPHTYTRTPSPDPAFIITLSGINANGCSGTNTFSVQVNAPQPFVTTTPSPSICVNSSITLVGNNMLSATSYSWNYGDGSAAQTFTGNTTAHTYTAGGSYTASLTATDNAGCQGRSTILVQVQEYPQAGFFFTNQCDPTKQVACAGCTIIFQDTSINAFPGPRSWNLATGSPVVGTPTVGTTYTTPGMYIVTLTVTTTFGCADVVKDTVRVYGAEADFTTNKTTICKGEAVTFTVGDTSNVFTWHWDYGDGTDDGKVSPTAHTYNFHPPGGTTNATLIYWTADSACKYSVVKPINIREIIAGFDRNLELTVKDSIHCLGPQDLFTNTSTGASTWSWNFGDGGTSQSFSPNHTYASPGTYTVTLSILDTQFGCKDTLRKKMVIQPLPLATISSQDTCAGRPSQLIATGNGPNYTYSWTPSQNLSNPGIFDPVATLTTSTVFTLQVTDPNGCTNTYTQSVYIQEPPKPISWDTTIVIGQQAFIPGNAGYGFTYSWTPTTDLSCSACPNPVSTSTVDIEYRVFVTDTMGCFSIVNTFTVHVEAKASVDVPTAFTPNGDGVNDIIYVKGWGIKKLNFFRIFNRWGQLIFESNDINIGWDGTYNGVPQNMETYVYQVSVETYVDDEPVTKASTFKLIR